MDGVGAEQMGTQPKHKNPRRSHVRDCQSEKSAAVANQSSGCRDLSKCTRLPNYNVALSQGCVFRGGIITVNQESSQKTKESQSKGEKVFSPFSRTFLC